MVRTSGTSRPSLVGYMVAFGSALEAAGYCGLKLYWEFGGSSGMGTGTGGNPYDSPQFTSAPAWTHFAASWGTIIMGALAVVISVASVSRWGRVVPQWVPTLAGAPVPGWLIAVPAWIGFAMLALTYTRLPLYVELLPYSLLYPNPLWATLLGATAASFTYRTWFRRAVDARDRSAPS